VSPECKVWNDTRFIGVYPQTEAPVMPRDRAEKQDDDATLLAFDRNAPPAPVDLYAFARRAGDIIARAAKALLGRANW
jgi:hypothetical protein